MNRIEWNPYLIERQHSSELLNKFKYQAKSQMNAKIIRNEIKTDVLFSQL